MKMSMTKKHPFGGTARETEMRKKSKMVCRDFRQTTISASLPLPDEIIRDVGIAHQIQPCALVVELGAGLAAVKQVEGQGGGYAEAAGQLVGYAGDLIA